MPPPGRKKLLQDFYAKYAPDQQLTEERIQAIDAKYSDDKQLLKDLYGKYAPNEQLNDDRIKAISDKYQLSKPAMPEFDPNKERLAKQDQTNQSQLANDLKASSDTRTERLKLNEISDAYDQTGGIQPIASFNKAVVGGVAALPKSVAILAQKLDSFTGNSKPIEEYATYQMGQWVEDKALDLGMTATDPTREGFFDTQVPQALGSVASILLTGGASLEAQGAKTLASTASTGAAKTVAKMATNPATVSGALQMAVPEYEAAKKEGMSDEEAFTVFLKNYAVGQTEALPLASAFSRVNKLTGGNLVEILKAGTKGGLEEATQEAVQNYFTNQIAKGSYDPARDPMMGLLDASKTGFFVGFVLPGIGKALSSASPEVKNRTNEFINNKLKERAVNQPTQEAAGDPVQRNEEQPQQPTPDQPIQPSAQETQLAQPVENTNLAADGQANQNPGNEVDPLSRGGEQSGAGIKQEDAENITRRVQEASPAAQGSQTSARQLKKEQDKELESYARQNGSFIENIKDSLGEKLDGGTEQDVYLSKDGDRVIKVNGLSNHSSWSEFWDRLNLQNKLFPDAAYKLVGFTKSGGRLSAVSEQPYIAGDPVPRQELIDDLAKRGFYQIHPEGSLGENQFYNPELGVRLSDVHGENVIKDSDGNIRYIDPMLDRENPFVDEESQKYFNEQKAKYSQSEGLTEQEIDFAKKRNTSLENVVPTRTVFKNPVSEQSQSDETAFFEASKNPSFYKGKVNVSNIFPTDLLMRKDALSGKVSDKLPVLYRTEKGYEVVDGHHRIAKKILSGDSQIEAQIFDKKGLAQSSQVDSNEKFSPEIKDAILKAYRTKEVVELPVYFLDKIKEFDRSSVDDTSNNIGRTRIDNLKEDIRSNGLNDPLTITINSKGNIVLTEGNHRLEALKELNYENVPVIVKERSDLLKNILKEKAEQDYYYRGDEKIGLNLNIDFNTEKKQTQSPEASQGAQINQSSNEEGKRIEGEQEKLLTNQEEVSTPPPVDLIADSNKSSRLYDEDLKNQILEKEKELSDLYKKYGDFEEKPADIKKVESDLRALREQGKIKTESIFKLPLTKNPKPKYLSSPIVQEVDVNKIAPTQETINKNYVKNPDPNYVPSLIKSGDIYLVNDGHHRIADAIESGYAKVKAAVRFSDKSEYENALKASEKSNLESETNKPTEEPKKERTIAKRYMADEAVSDEIKQGLSEQGRYYIPTTDLKRQAEADAYIEEKGIDQAIEDITDPDNGMSDQNRIFIGKTIYGLLKQEVKTSENPNSVRDKINRLVESIAQLGTKAGQTVQAFTNMFASDAEQVAHGLKKEYEKQRNKAAADNETEVSDLISLVLDKAPREALQNLIKDPRIQALISDSKKNENVRQSKRKQFTQKVLNKLDEIEKQLDENTKSGRLNADLTMGLSTVVFKAAINTVRLAVKAGDSLADAVEKAINEVKKNNKDWDESDFRKQFAADIKEERKADRKTLLEYLESDNFKTLALEHYKNLKAKKDDLRAALEEDLETGEVKRLMDTLDKIVGEKRQKLIDQKFAKKITTPKKKRLTKQLADKIKEFTDLGVLSDKKIRDAYLESIELPAITDEQSAKLEKLVEIAESKPMGWQRFEAVQDMIRYHQQITPVSWGSVVGSIWYANMLSGISTHKVNFEANAVRTLSEIFVSSVQSVIEYKNPKAAFAAISYQLKGLVDGYNAGRLESANVLKNGYFPVKSNKFEGFAGVKTSNASVLEVLDSKNPLSYWKYIGRLLTATDILFYGGMKGMRAHQLAFREAYNKTQNTFDKAALNKANEIVGKTSIQLDRAKTQAEQEGLTGRQKNRRIYEIMEQTWSETNREDAGSFAAKGTYNQDPEGVMGLFSSAINTFTTKVPAAKVVVPFTRVISNVVNDYLDYTPWGLVRASKGGMGIPNNWKLVTNLVGSSYTKFTPEELLREKIKAITGSMVMVTLYAMSQADDGEEPLLEITSDGTGSFKKNFELAGTGWKEYTAKVNGSNVRFDYRNTQMAIPFAVIGYINDAKKYKKNELNDTQVGLIFSGTFHFMSDLSFLSGMSDFFEILSEEKTIGEKMTKFAARTIKTGIVPNAFTQVSRSVQEITDSPMKKGDTLYAQLFRDFPGLRDSMGNMYNTLGEPIVTETLYKFNPLKMSTMADNKEKDSYKLWEMIVNNNAYIGSPSKAIKIYDPALGVDRALTPDEYDKFALAAARYTKEMLLIDYDNLAAEQDKKVIKDRIYQIKEQARERAKAELFDSMN